MKYIFILCLLSTYSILGQVLILQFSDTHSAYGNIETFTRNILHEINEFKEIHPQGEVLFIHSGDISGVGEFTHFDKGNSNYDFFAALTKNHHFTLTMGNHDGADWSFNVLMDQVQYFEKTMREHGHKDWKMLAANIQGKIPSISQHFKAYQDIVLKNGKKVRVVGLVLDDLFSYSNEWLEENLEIRTMLSTAKEQYSFALRDNVDRIIFSAHEELNKPNMQKFEESLSKWLDKNSKYKAIKNNLIFSAHDHTVQIHDGMHARIVSSGSAYKYFSKTILDKKLNIMEKPLLLDALKSRPEVQISFIMKKTLANIQKQIQDTNQINNKIIAQNPVDLAIRGALKIAPHYNGIIVSNAFRDWAKSEINSQGVIDHLAFFNSGSYRGSEVIKSGDFTYGDTKKIAPFPNEAKLYITKGKYITKTYRALRASMGKEHTPQVSSNLREIPLGSMELLHYNKALNKWLPLEEESSYAIAFDGWLGKNGFKLPEFDELISESLYVESNLKHESEILVKFIPRVLEEEALKIKASCDELYSKL